MVFMIFTSAFYVLAIYWFWCRYSTFLPYMHNKLLAFTYQQRLKLSQQFWIP